MSTAAEAFHLACDAVLSPRKAVDRLLGAEDRRVKPAAAILLAYMAVSAVFYRLKPESFPTPPEGWVPPETPRGLLFWAKVQLWTPALTAVLVVTTAWYAQLLKGERLPRRMLAAVLCGAIPVLLFVVYANHAIGPWTFAAAWAGLAALMAPGARRVARPEWLGAAAVLMSVNALALAMTPAFAFAVALRSDAFYHSLEMALLLWTLGVSTHGVGRALGVPAARAFVAVFLGLLAQILFVFSMHTLGVLPDEILKALMAV